MEQQYQEDLEYFIEQTETKRGEKKDSRYPDEYKHLDFYFLHTKEEMNEYINQYLINNTIKNKYDFLYFMKTLIKYMSGVHDSHTKIDVKESLELPIKLKWVENSIFIDQYIDSNFNKTKIISINGVDIDIIKKEIEKTISYGTNNWLKARTEGDLVKVSNLLSLPSIDADTNEIIIKTERGDLHFSPFEQIEHNLNDKQENSILIKNNVLIYKYPKCIEKYQPNLDEITSMINNFNIDCFILDLRGNSGGNSNIIKPLIAYLGSTNLKLVTLVDRYVFSSGHFAAVEMQKIGSKVVGEDIGTPDNAFGYIVFGGRMPNTNFIFTFSKVYWYKDEMTNLMRGIYTKENLKDMPQSFFEPQYLELDQYIELTEEEYLSINKDVVLEKTYQYVIDELKKVR